jgi:hypothetical protein
MLMGMHEDQLAIDNKIVRRLIDEQLPQWRSLPVRQVPATGTVNAIFRMGNDLAARFPLRAQDWHRVRDLLYAEAAAMRELADASSVSAPQPVAIGEPGLSQPGHRCTGHRRGRPCHAGGAGPEDYRGADVRVRRPAPTSLSSGATRAPTGEGSHR